MAPKAGIRGCLGVRVCVPLVCVVAIGEPQRAPTEERSKEMEWRGCTEERRSLRSQHLNRVGVDTHGAVNQLWSLLTVGEELTKKASLWYAGEAAVISVQRSPYTIVVLSTVPLMALLYLNAWDAFTFCLLACSEGWLAKWGCLFVCVSHRLSHIPTESAIVRLLILSIEDRKSVV